MNAYYFAYTEYWRRIGESVEGIFKEICAESESSSFKVIPARTETPKLLDPAPDLMIMPLFEMEKGNIYPRGLSLARSIRKGDWKGGERDFVTFFVYLVNNVDEVPNPLAPKMGTTGYVNAVIGRPDFGSTDKAVLCAEVAYEKGVGSATDNLLNVISIVSMNFRSRLEVCVKRIEQILKEDRRIKRIAEYRRLYYDTFIDFYDRFCDKPTDLVQLVREIESGSVSNAGDIHTLISTLRRWQGEKEKLGSLLCYINELQWRLHGTEYRSSGHRVPAENFTAPVPFVLDELLTVRDEIERISRSGRKKIRLLLVDNNTEKFVGSGNAGEIVPGRLGALLQNDILGLKGLFELRMLGGSVLTEEGLLNAQGEVITRFTEFLEDKERFTWTGESADFHSWEVIYERIRKTHFILLDFFLNRENTYLAHDFMRDIAQLKELKDDVSSSWYFITSSVYDSVVKHAQSGLLAEYYETTVVNTGDDPVNRMRQILFVYKLLTFIRARLRRFSHYKEKIIEVRFINVGGQCSKHMCCENPKVCLDSALGTIQRVLVEYENLYSIFYPEKHKRDIKRVFEILENVIKQFFWLPEADWPVIQRQIDFMNSILSHIPDLSQRKFSCTHIINELKKRSDVF